MLNLSTLLETSASDLPDRPAIVQGDRRVTYAELDAGARRFAAALSRAGVGRGDRVALLLPNIPDFAVAYYGSLVSGATVVPLNVLLKAREIAYHLNDSSARLLVAFEGFAPEARRSLEDAPGCEQLWVAGGDGAGGPSEDGKIRSLGEVLRSAPEEFDPAQRMPDDTAVILYTSGTTGQAKGAELTHFNMFFNALYCAERLFHLTSDDVLMAVLPLFHSFGQTCVMNAGFYAGAAVALQPRFDAEKVLRSLAKDGVTVFAGVPTMYWALLNHPDRARHAGAIRDSLRLCVSGGAAMPVELMRQFEETFGVTILEGYGLSETSPVATFNRSREERKTGSIGKTIWGTRVAVFDDSDREVPRGEKGEIVVRGHNVMKGYLGRPEATAEAMRSGWFHTGDVAYQDEDGFFYIVDRKKDMILRGGFNVYPREIEELLMTHPAVSLVAVVGVPDERLGEEVKAYVVRKPAGGASEEEILGWCRERLASFKCPRSVEFRDALPMTATGKVLKRELR
ncbi:MAG: long-chain fatty acid--CoA ligase [Thermoanaerobaculia bacterium]